MSLLNSVLTPPSSSAPSQVSHDLRQLSMSQLEGLLGDEAEVYQDFLRKWIAQLPAARALEDVQTQNRALAQDNMAMQGSLEEARNHVAIVRSSEYAAAKDKFDELLQSQRQVCACLAPTVLLDKLQAAVNEVDDKSIALHDRFHRGELQADQFVEQYSKIRAQFHVLDLKQRAARSSFYTNDGSI